MRSATHYTPTETGYAISGSAEIFNRTLYGSHAADYKPERFFTFAGDAPQFMGALCDWTKDLVAFQEKAGVLNSGLAITPGRRARFYYTNDIDQTSRWFHDSEDVLAEFKNGWMEYELSQLSSWFPDVRVQLEAYPLLPEDGFLVHYHISTDQRVYFVAGFGGLTEMQGRFEYKGEPRRNFVPENAKGNVVTIGENRACVTHSDGKTMRIAASFPAEFAVGSAQAMADRYPSTFLGSTPAHGDDQVVRISAPIEPGRDLDGYLVVLHNADDAAVDRWLTRKNPIAFLKQQIYAKASCLQVSTPEQPLDLTITPTVLAMDASWHENSFHHGAFAYHAPFLGWRNWYAPTALGWYDRVAKTVRMHFAHITRGDVSKERAWLDTTPIPDGENQFMRSIHNLENSVGRLPAYYNSDLTPVYGPYNMQECALDMILYYIEWSGDLKLAEELFDDFVSMVEWERRVFDPDDDGLYQNVLNTWISDGHNYNGAGCAQSTAYNYRANRVLAQIAEKLGRDGSRLAARAEKIRKALLEKLWIPHDGVIAESLDTVGNCLLHPSAELATVYHVIDSDMLDDLRAYRTLRYTERHLQNITTPGNGGRLCYSSNWLPKQYSNCGIFPAENAHLALMYFKLGLKEQGKLLLDGIADCYFTGKNPGMAAHIQSARCASDFGDQDFSDVSGTYLRLVVEGLFGIRFNHLENRVTIAPGFPADWEHASLSLKDLSLHYHRRGNQESYEIFCDRRETKCLRIPLRAADPEAVLLDGEPAAYTLVPGPNCCFLLVETDKTGRFRLQVMHGSRPVPTVTGPETVLAGSRLAFTVQGGQLLELADVSEVLEQITVSGNRVYAMAKAVPGDHTLFFRVRSGEYDTWLAADYDIQQEEWLPEPLPEKPFTPVELGAFFNCSITELHRQAYTSPKPEGYSMGLLQNGRYAYSWNQYGRYTAHADDQFFRQSGGTVYSPSGIPFTTPASGNNLACVSVFDVFPDKLTVPLTGKGQELALLFIASTYCMQAYVDNARITVTYADGSTQTTALVYPVNIDDWLTAALTTEGEILQFNHFNHATVQRIRLNPERELASVTVEAVANEVILGIAGISLS